MDVFFVGQIYTDKMIYKYTLLRTYKVILTNVHGFNSEGATQAPDRGAHPPLCRRLNGNAPEGVGPARGKMSPKILRQLKTNIFFYDRQKDKPFF